MNNCHSVTLIVQNVCMMFVVGIRVITVVVDQPADCCFTPSICTSRTPGAFNLCNIHSTLSQCLRICSKCGQIIWLHMLECLGLLLGRRHLGCPSSPGSGHLPWYCYGAGGCRNAVHDVLEVLDCIQVWGIGGPMLSSPGSVGREFSLTRQDRVPIAEMSWRWVWGSLPRTRPHSR